MLPTATNAHKLTSTAVVTITLLSSSQFLLIATVSAVLYFFGYDRYYYSY